MPDGELLSLSVQNLYFVFGALSFPLFPLKKMRFILLSVGCGVKVVRKEWPYRPLHWKLPVIVRRVLLLTSSALLVSSVMEVVAETEHAWPWGGQPSQRADKKIVWMDGCFFVFM